MINIAINTRVGGFRLSAKAIKRLAELEGKECFFFVCQSFNKYVQVNIEDIGDSRFYAYSDCSLDSKNYISAHDYKRDNPKLIQVINELGDEVNTRFSSIKIVEIPEGVDWEIEEDSDGTEVVREKSRIWS